MKKILFLALTTWAFAACSDQKPTFTVEGTIDGVKDTTIYLYNNALSGAVKVDSAKIGEDGAFTLKGEAPKDPELYCINLGNQIIYVGIDSTETVTIHAKAPNIARDYEVEGSVNSQKIKELSLKQQDLRAKVIAIQNNLDLNREQITEALQQLVDAYKAEIANDYIYENPGSIYAYFALFQTLGGYNLFDRSNAQDVRAFAAVATSWDTFHPESERTKHLHNTTIKGMNDTRQQAAREMMQAEAVSKVETTGLIELELPDVSGQTRTLTELNGKVVLLDFHMFGMKESAVRILSLRDLYAKYHAQGLEIYQVGLDENEHFWKQQTESLPWICVYDPLAQSALHYNVQNVPEYFLIDRNSQLYKRSTQMKDVEAEIKSLLANPTSSAK